MTPSDSPENNPTQNGAAEPHAIEPPVIDIGSQAHQDAPPPPKPATGPVWSVGRRKSSVARVRLTPGEGKYVINKREPNKYFTELQEQIAIRDPLMATKTDKSYDVMVNVRGGGHTGQSDAIRLGVARALLKADGRHEAALRESGFLTRDSRVVERKKYGRAKARKRFQFSKR